MRAPPVELLEFAGNVGLALLLGTLIGLEREYTRHPAGLQTNALVAVGAALFVTLTRLVGDTNNPTHIIGYVVVGIGFLGGGAILKEGMQIRGLTTSAGIWCAAAVGTLSGLGFAAHAVIGTGFVLLILFGLLPLDRWIDARRHQPRGGEVRYRVRVNCDESAKDTVGTVLLQEVATIPLASIVGIKSRKQGERVRVTAHLCLPAAGDQAVRELANRLLGEPGVLAASWKRLPPPIE
ncbi:MAG: MgtC/SapB family protein [Gemmataceae bacterium]